MRIKLDENLPIGLSPLLRKLGHEVSTIRDESLEGAPDSEIWQAAQRESRLLITQDLDFSDLRIFIPGTHYGILLVRLQSPSRQTLSERITTVFTAENVEAWKGCFVIVSSRKIRVLRAPNPPRPSGPN
jgi:predicted nuclease of predicted toxin-antitoxin system